MIEQLVARVFQARNIAHRAHFATTGHGSHARHEALGEFYEAVIPAIDTTIEAHQGRYGLIETFGVNDRIVGDIVSYVRDEMLWIEENRDKFSQCQAALNRIDDLSAIYLRTCFKLENLQ